MAPFDRPQPEEKAHPSIAPLAEHISDFLAQTDDGYVIYGADFSFVAINPGGCRLLGVTATAIGQACTAVLGSQAADIEPFLEEVLETGEQAYVEHSFAVEQQPRYLDAVYTPIRNAQGAVVQILGLYRDLTHLKELQHQRDRNLEQRAQQAEARLRQVEDQKQQTEEQLRASFTYGPVAKALVGKQGEILQVNPALCQLIGYSAAELQQHFVSDFTYPDDLPIDQELRESLKRNNGISDQCEKRLVHKNGQPIWTLVSVVWVKQEDNDEPSFYIVEMQNLTELKETELALKEAKETAEEATRAKSAFLAMMSHEIRTPMNAVIGSAELLNETPLNPQQVEYIQTIQTGGTSLLSVIDDILIVSRIEADRLELDTRPLSVQTCVEEALDIVQTKALEKGLELISFVESQTPAVIVGDHNRLRQILINLLSNAVKFTETGEVLVSVSATALTSPPMLPASQLASAPSYELTFTVQDTGIGIAPEQQVLLFQSFSQADTSITRRYGGTGLGLAISKGLCELMQGRIWVESQLGEGATFRFTIQAPASTDAVGAPVEISHINADILKDRSVLVVDDNQTNRRILGLQLQTWGMQPTLAASGSEALAMFAQGRRFAIALLDVQMPEMDGLALTAALQQQLGRQAPPIILLSSVGPVGKALEAASLTVVAALSKPVKKANLLRLLQQALSRIAPTPPDTPPEPHPPKPPPLPLKILVAEDNRVNQKVALRMLERLGYKADLVTTGLDVLAALQQQAYDVIFLDIQMPEMDGYTTAQRICQDWPAPERPYLIAMTANAMEGDREACLAAGMDDYVSKPIHLKDLEEALAHCRL